MFLHDENDEGLFISSKGIQLISSNLEDIFQEYEDELGRKPTIEEIERILLGALQAYPDHVVDKIVSGIKVKMKKKTKKDLFNTGNVFAIPLENKKGYFYGEIKRDTKEGIYIEYYNLVTDKRISINDFLKVAPPVIVTICTGETSITSGFWKLIGRVPRVNAEYLIPNFFGKEDGKYYISYGLSNCPDTRVFVDESIAKQQINPDGLFGAKIAAYYVEKLLEEDKQ